MVRVKEPPSGSIVRVEDFLDGVNLTWKKSQKGLSRYILLAFFFCWLVFWFAVEVHTGIEMIEHYWEGLTPSILELLLLIAWSIAGFFMIAIFLAVMRKPAEASLYMDNYGLIYQAARLNTESEKSFVSCLNRPRKIHAKKEKIENLKLERINQDLRLTFDLGVHRIELGSELSEPEKEWLHREIEKTIRVQTNS